MSDDMLIEETLSSETIFEGRVVHLRVDQVRLPSGRTTAREQYGHGDGDADYCEVQSVIHLKTR